MIDKDYADIILSNTKEVLFNANYFKHTRTMCRNIEKVREAIKHGFERED